MLRNRPRAVLKRFLSVLLSASLIHLTGCGKAAVGQPVYKEQAAPLAVVTQVSWSKAIRIEGDAQFSTPLGLANAPISGTSLQELVTNPAVAVRADGNSCMSCHGGFGSLRPEWSAKKLSARDMCNLIPSFLAAKKPAILKEVFKTWGEVGCSE